MEAPLLIAAFVLPEERMPLALKVCDAFEKVRLFAARFRVFTAAVVCAVMLPLSLISVAFVVVPNVVPEVSALALVSVP